MDSQKQPEKPKVKNPTGMVCLHLLVIGYAVYMFYTVLRDYLAGGPGAPGLSTVIIGAVVLLGGSAVLAFFSLRLFKQAKKEQGQKPESSSEGSGSDPE